MHSCFAVGHRLVRSSFLTAFARCQGRGSVFVEKVAWPGGFTVTPASDVAAQPRVACSVQSLTHTARGHGCTMKRGHGGDPVGPSKRLNSGAARPMGAQAAASTSKLTTNDALSYLREVKQRFADDKNIYDTFLEIMKDFKAQRVDTAGVIIKVKDLFKGHRELILGFNTFLPKGYEITLPPEEEKKPVEFDQAISYVNKIKLRFAHDERVYKAFLEILNMYRKGQKTINQVYEEVALLFEAHKDLLTEFTYFLPDNTAPERAPARAPAKRGTGRGRVGGRPVTEQGVLRNLNKRKSARRGDDYDEEDAHLARSNLAKELQFFERVKTKLRSRETYQDLLKCLNMFAQEITSRDEMLAMVNDLLGRMPELMMSFNEFLRRCEVLDLDVDPKMAQQGRLSARDIQKMKMMTNAEKLATRPISELDVSAWPRCSTSYVQLPKDYPSFKCGGRTPEQASILNDIWVSVTSGSEDYSFKHMRKNVYEEQLFRSEDERFELDMVIECGASAIRAMAPLAAQLAPLPPDVKANWRLPSNVTLSPIHYRAVQRIYGEHGHQMVKLMKENPAYAIPIVFKRLQQKDAEWREAKRSATVQWRKVFEGNYHRSLDHRSFYFKQVDKRHLGAKGMIQEIRDVAEKWRQSDAGLPALSAAAPFSRRLSPNLTYDYSNRVVHEHCWTVVRWAILAIGSGDSAARMLRFYSRLLEHFMGVDPRSPEELAAPEEKDERKAATDADRAKRAIKARKKGRVSALVAEAADGAETDPESAATPVGSVAKAAMANGDGTGDDHNGSKGDDGANAMETDVEDDADTVADTKDARDASSPEGDEEDVHDAPAAFGHCKPLAPMTRGIAMQALAGGEGGGGEEAGRPTAEDGLGDDTLRVFYGNDTYYVLLRLHQYLYDRLRVAHTCALRKPVFQQTGATAHKEAGNSPEEYARIHGEFMTMVHDLIDGSLESSAYEDHCRALLGTGSYVLFTLEKLVYKVVKQMQTLLTDDLTHKLYELYQYEHARGLPISDATYYANAHVLLHDDTCFRFAYKRNDTATIQMMDPDKTEVSPGIMEPAFAQYLKQFTGSSSGRDAGAKVFLLRNFPDGREPDPEAAAEAAQRDAHLVNGLECKLSCSTSKVSYVLDTEDIFRRLKKAMPVVRHEVVAAKSAKFRRWQEETHRTMPLQPPQTAPAWSTVNA